VFINPVVASLPEHAHLFSEHGCFKDFKNKTIYHRECATSEGVESKLPDSFYPLELTPDQDEAWLKQVKLSITAARREAEAAGKKMT
jgi:hypothetical protein